MNARAVFAVLKAAQELKLKERSEFMVSLCDIAIMPSQNIEYFKAIQNRFISVSENAVPEHKKKTNGNVMPWAAAAELMRSAEQTKIRLERGAR